jgi:putative FmdB family regulatory protein
VPLYEYECEQCGRFELIRKFSDEPLTICPTCGREIQKLPSAPAFHLKGTGWYITDYARKSGGGDASKEGGSKSEGAKESAAKEGGTKGESASSTKSETTTSDSTKSSSESTSTSTTAASKDTSATSSGGSSSAK